MLETLKEAAFSLRLIELSDQKKNGLLTLEYQKVKKIISFEKGNIRYALSNVKNESFLEYLITLGLMDRAQILHLPRDLGITWKTLRQISSRGLMTEEEALQKAKNLIRAIIKSCFKVKGKLSFQEGRVNLEGKVTTQISPVEMVLDYYRNDASPLECAAILGEENSIPGHSPDALEKIKEIPFNPLEKDILKMIDGQTNISDFMKIFPSGPEEIWRGLANLYLLKAIEIKDPARSGSPSEALDGPSNGCSSSISKHGKNSEKIHYYIKVYERHNHSNYFQLLGVQRYSSLEEIQKNYYALAKELHPDKFQDESMKEIKPMMESLFARICEAYEVLSHEERRKEYEEEIFERVTVRSKVHEERLNNASTARGNFLMGKKFFNEGRYSEAFKFFENAVHLDGTRWEYYFHLAMTQSKNPRYRAEAIYNFKKSISMNPANAEAYLHLGLLYKKCHKISEAKNMLKCALQWDPENNEILQELKNFEKMTKK